MKRVNEPSGPPLDLELRAPLGVEQSQLEPLREVNRRPAEGIADHDALRASEDAGVKVAAAHHGEGVRLVKVRLTVLRLLGEIGGREGQGIAACFGFALLAVDNGAVEE